MRLFIFLTTAGNKLVLHLCNIKSREIKNDKRERSKTQNEEELSAQRAHTNTTRKVFSFLYLTLRALQTRFKNHFLHTSRRWINKIRLFVCLFPAQKTLYFCFSFRCMGNSPTVDYGNGASEIKYDKELEKQSGETSKGNRFWI
jgi:sensor histidine kinase YesM